ncbi:hypothetical protein [Burkholderia sp. BE17]|uniref:hypothetical protein n=1 Tax=Burkholderia sp. BE17 TaxID=2656644 RepID=UPI00128CAE41|nr:hypothetical protein [Burkholderia sp. BE17]MPV64381.1 hypothetical protein [Burkholderia sp. BE17]
MADSVSQAEHIEAKAATSGNNKELGKGVVLVTCAGSAILTVEAADIVNSAQPNGATDNLSVRLFMAKKLLMGPVVAWVCTVSSVPVPARL